MKCKHCGKAIDSDSVYCEFCGMKVETETPPKKKGSRFLWLAVALGIIIGAVQVSLRQCNRDTADKASQDKEMAIRTINRYNDALLSNDFATLSTVYADKVERYFDAYDQTNAEVIKHNEKYDATFKVTGKHTSVRWETLKVERLSDGDLSVVYIEDYSIDRKDKSKYSKFVLEKHLILNKQYKIKSIYDVPLDRS